MRQHSSPVGCKDLLEGNQSYLCTTAPYQEMHASSQETHSNNEEFMAIGNNEARE